MALAKITATTTVVNGQSITVSGITQNTVSSGTVSLLASLGKSAISQNPITAILTNDTFTATFPGVPPGTYIPSIVLTNGGGSATIGGDNGSIIAIIGNPTFGVAATPIGGTPSVTIHALHVTGRTLNVNGVLDWQGDDNGTLLAFLNPQPSGTSVQVTLGISGAPTPNIVGNFWGLQTLLVGNSYKLRMVITANSLTSTTISETFSINEVTGQASFQKAMIAASLIWQNFSNLIPGATNTATYAFIGGEPSSITLTLSGVVIPLTDLNINITSGSGNTATGTITFNFTNPVAGTYTLRAHSISNFAVTSTIVDLIIAEPTLTFAYFSNFSPNYSNATAAYTFMNGAPDTVYATLNGSPFQISNIVVTTTSGSGNTSSGIAAFTYTNPNVGVYSLVVHGAGYYHPTALAVNLVVNNIALTWVSFSNLIAGHGNTATYSFTGGAPSGVSVIAGGPGVYLTTSNFTVHVISGSNATAAGTVTFTFINPTASSYNIIVTTTGLYGSQNPSITTLTTVIS
jgi:hypothetical protein